MNIKLLDKKHIFKISEGSISNLLPRVFLCGRLVLSTKSIRTFSDTLNQNIHGFLAVLDFGDIDADIIFFRDDDNSIFYFQLNIPTNITLCKHQFPSDGKDYNFISQERFTDYKNSANFANYNQFRDEFVVSYIPLDVKNNVKAIKIAQDFCLLLLDNIVIGWKLSNTSRYIVDFEGNDYVFKSKETLSIISQYWSLFQEANFEKMNEGDLLFKKQLEYVLNLAHKEDIYPVVEVLEDWIDMNYY